MVIIQRLLLAVLATVFLVFAYVCCASTHHEQAADNKRIYEKYARTYFSDLDRQVGGRLEPLFSQLSHVHAVNNFITDDETQPAYKELLVAALEKNAQGNILDGMFVALLLHMTPPDIVVEAVVPELGIEGRLRGILDWPGSHIRKHIERQSKEGHPGEPDFRHYASYLEIHKDVESSTYLIRHMFKSDPSEALRAMISVQYLLPYPPLNLSNESPSVIAKVRPLLYAEHIISDAIWHEQFRFDVAEDQFAKAKNELSALSQQKDWWVRLYAAEIMQQHSELRVPDVTERLQKDENELVRQAIAREDAMSAIPRAAPDAGNVPVE